MRCPRSARGTAAAVAQIVPAPLRAVGDLQAARRRGGVDGLHVVVAPVVVDDSDAGAVGYLDVFGSGAERRLPGATAAEGLAKAEHTARVVDTAHGLIACVQGTATVGDSAAACGELE